jgi:hypothetical protein
MRDAQEHHFSTPALSVHIVARPMNKMTRVYENKYLFIIHKRNAQLWKNQGGRLSVRSAPGSFMGTGTVSWKISAFNCCGLDWVAVAVSSVVVLASLA